MHISLCAQLHLVLDVFAARLPDRRKKQKGQAPGRGIESMIQTTTLDGPMTGALLRLHYGSVRSYSRRCAECWRRRGSGTQPQSSWGPCRCRGVPLSNGQGNLRAEGPEGPLKIMASGATLGHVFVPWLGSVDFSIRS